MNDAVFNVAASGVGERFILDTVVLFIGKLEISKMRSRLTVENGFNIIPQVSTLSLSVMKTKSLGLRCKNRNTFQKGVIFFTLPMSFPALLKKSDPYEKVPNTILLVFCEYDPYGLGEPTYEFRLLNQEYGVRMKRDVRIIFVNCKSERLNEEQKM